jgi:hypothetical protein
MPDDRAGKKGKCPKCKHAIVVPEPVDRGQSSDQQAPCDTDVGAESSHYDLTLLDAPPRAEPQKPPADHSTRTDDYEQMAAIAPGHLNRDEEPPPQRKLPWLIDVFLYPLSKPGLIILVIFVGIPLVLHFVTKVLAAITLIFTPMFVFLVLFQLLRILAGLVVFLYVFWYLCECIYDSAHGGIRAPETAGITPGLAELFWQILRVFICLAFFCAPAASYYTYRQQVDAILLALYGSAAFFFPMGLLAVIMFDSLRALNPLLIFGSIFSTSFRYVGIVVFIAGVCLLVVKVVLILRGSWLAAHLAKLAAIYLLLVVAHLIGRFFWRNQDRLNWEV